MTIKTESLELEYSIFYQVFKNTEKAIKKLNERGIVGDYFASIFHREVYNEILVLYKQGKTLSFPAFKRHFLGRSNVSTDSEIKLTTFAEGIKQNKSNFSDIEHECEQLLKLFATRKVLSNINSSIDDMESKDIEEVLDGLEANARLMKATLDTNAIKSVMGLIGDLDMRVDRAEEVKNNPEKAGLSRTGLKNIDKHIGRQTPGQFIIYLARTGIGKSMMLMGTALANFKAGLKVIVITIEMSTYDYLYRMDANLTGFKHKSFVSGDITDEAAIIDKWKEKVEGHGNGVDDLLVYWVPSNCTPAKVESIIASNPFKPDVVIVDYAGDMKAGIRGIPDYDPRAHAEIYSSLKEMAGKYECIVFTAQQSRRGVKKTDTESGAWSDVASAKADMMLAVEITKEDEDFMTDVDGDVVVGRMTVSVIKGRNVPKCKTHIIPMFDRMSWLEKEEENMNPVDGGMVTQSPQKEAQVKMEKASSALANAIGGADSLDDFDVD